MQNKIQVLVWNEFIHERDEGHLAAKIYPEGIHEAIAGHLRTLGDMDVETATLDQPEQGLSAEVLRQTDVLIWWGHAGHDDLSDEVVERIRERILQGMGLICLHSAHFSKIFRKMLGTSCDLKWREAGEKERLWVVEPGHPIASGLPEYFEIPAAEMYGERFDIPQPETTVLLSWFPGGEVFRSGCCFLRGGGRIFYFRPGHESHPIYYQQEVLQVIANAVRWAAPVSGPQIKFGNHQPLEKI